MEIPVSDLMDAATLSKENVEFDVSYEVPGKGKVSEAIVRRVKNGIAANYIEPYMRRRDPDTMAIADDPFYFLILTQNRKPQH